MMFVISATSKRVEFAVQRACRRRTRRTVRRDSHNNACLPRMSERHTNDSVFAIFLQLLEPDHHTVTVAGALLLT